MVIIPSIVIAFASMKTPKYFKPIAVIFVLASLTAITSYTVFGFVGPGAQFAFHTHGQNVTNATTPVVTSNCSSDFNQHSCSMHLFKEIQVLTLPRYQLQKVT